MLQRQSLFLLAVGASCLTEMHVLILQRAGRGFIELLSDLLAC
jgi:hypothetical protein